MTDPMTELILHHFPASPFSEKARLVLGYKRLSWKSVIVPAIMPKPDVVALTGGYRRTPFLQIGADIYCDTALICEVIQRFQVEPSLYPEPGTTLARIVGQWAEETLFWAAVRHNRGPKGSGLNFGVSAEKTAALFEYRKAMGFDLDWQRPADAAAPYQSYLQRLDQLLGRQMFLLGEQPCIADFCVYHPLWLAHLRTAPVLDVLAPWPTLAAWLARMQAIGHGREQGFDATQAIAVAAQAQPMAPGSNLLPETAFHDEHGIALGSQVSVAAQSFGLEPTQGELVAATRTHFTLRRMDHRVGTVHVHFPRIGYVLQQSEPGVTAMSANNNRAAALRNAGAPERASRLRI